MCYLHARVKIPEVRDEHQKKLADKKIQKEEEKLESEKRYREYLEFRGKYAEFIEKEKRDEVEKAVKAYSRKVKTKLSSNKSGDGSLFGIEPTSFLIGYGVGHI